MFVMQTKAIDRIETIKIRKCVCLCQSLASFFFFRTTPKSVASSATKWNQLKLMCFCVAHKNGQISRFAYFLGKEMTNDFASVSCIKPMWLHAPGVVQVN